MVVRERAASVFAAAAVMALLGSSCGGESSHGGAGGRSGGTGGTATRDAGASALGGAGGTSGTGDGTISDGQGGFEDAAGAGPEAIALGGSACETRRSADCEGIVGSSYYSTHGTFDASPELAACSAGVSFDGCGELVYVFDDDGCAKSVDPGPGGWRQSEHLSPLRDCLSAAFSEARFACLASRSFAFYESCFIR